MSALLSTTSYAVVDSMTMLRRSVRRLLRYPTTIFFTAGIPIIFMLLFVYVFGGTLGAGLGDPSGGRAAYVNYVAPGILLMTIAVAPQGTALTVATDMTEGIINRFRTMAVAHASVLTGHVIASMIQTMISVGIVIAVALLIGFRPTAGPLEWVAAVGVLAAISLALSWLGVAFGLLSKGPETAGNVPALLMLMPFVGSGFVPTDSMPAGLRFFAEYQPFTPIMETLRGLLIGTPIGSNAIVALAWCAGIALIGYAWAKKLYNRDPVR